MAIPNGFKIINLNNIKNYYYISEIGKVYSTYSNKILKPKCDKYGYFSISLCTNNNERKTYYIHQLVINTYVENAPIYMKDPTVDHIDGKRDHSTGLRVRKLYRIKG